MTGSVSCGSATPKLPESSCCSSGLPCSAGEMPCGVPADSGARQQFYRLPEPAGECPVFPVPAAGQQNKTAGGSSGNTNFPETSGKAAVPLRFFLPAALLCGGDAFPAGEPVLPQSAQSQRMDPRICCWVSLPHTAPTSSRPKSTATPAPRAVMILPSRMTPSLPISAPVSSFSKPV